MSGVRFICTTPDGSTTGVAEKIALLIGPRANQRALVEEFEVTFGGDDPAEDPVFCELVILSDDGESGDGVAVTPAKVNTSDDETIQTVSIANIDNSTQPSEVRVLDKKYVHPCGGHWAWRASKECPPYPCKGGEFLGIRITAQQDNPYAARIVANE